MLQCELEITAPRDSNPHFHALSRAKGPSGQTPLITTISDFVGLGYFVRQELGGNEAVRLHVLRPVDHTHASAAQLLYDAVVRYGLADHRPEMLGPEIRQANEGWAVGGVVTSG